MATVTVNDIELFYERRGAGEPLLLIMGMSGTSAHWGEPFLELLERDFEVIVYDHRGIGQSAPYMTPFTIRELAADALALLDALAVPRAHVYGISMGGMVAQELVLAAPERVTTLTLGCTYPGGPEGVMTAPADMQMLGEAFASRDRDRTLRALYDVNVSAAYAADPANYDVFLERGRENPASTSYIALQGQAIAGHDASGRLGEITAPTVVVHGTEDRMLPVANAEVIGRLMPGARVEIMEGIGHLYFWERPEESAALMRALAASATPTAS
ncbi:MAG: alpha/beta fold hydrolase [Solirubrobacteraceae bacterium]|nr:alpha/beta fold hydrolase [Solirubrobacteraceae bacterium]